MRPILLGASSAAPAVIAAPCGQAAWGTGPCAHRKCVNVQVKPTPPIQNCGRRSQDPKRPAIVSGPCRSWFASTSEGASGQSASTPTDRDATPVDAGSTGEPKATTASTSRRYPRNGPPTGGMAARLASDTRASQMLNFRPHRLGDEFCDGHMCVCGKGSRIRCRAAGPHQYWGAADLPYHGLGS